MYNLDEINADQLVTATDRALCSGALAKHRQLARSSQNLSVAAHVALVRSAMKAAVATVDSSEERTVYVRARPSTRPMYMLCAAASAAWLCVAAVCLLA